MNRRSFAVPAIALLLACAGPSLADVAVGEVAPDFRLADLAGTEVTLAGLKGKTVVLEWINPNCPVSRRHADARTMITTSAEHPDVIWLGINSTSAASGDFIEPADHQSYNDTKGIGYPVLYDSAGQVGRDYGAKTTPHMYVIDPAGKIAYIGAIDDAPRGGAAQVNYVDSALDALAAGARPDPSSTRPYGCSVKY